MTAQQPQALPECGLCEKPTRRRAWLANAGLCTDCADTIADINHRLAQQNTVRPLFPVDER